jgi:hypothetical protein
MLSENGGKKNGQRRVDTIHPPTLGSTQLFGGGNVPHTNFFNHLTSISCKIDHATMENFPSLKNSWMLCKLKSVGAS